MAEKQTTNLIAERFLLIKIKKVTLLFTSNYGAAAIYNRYIPHFDLLLFIHLCKWSGFSIIGHSVSLQLRTVIYENK